MAETTPGAQEETQAEVPTSDIISLVVQLGELPTSSGEQTESINKALSQFSKDATLKLFVLDNGETLIDPKGYKCSIDGMVATVRAGTGAKLGKGNQAKLRVEEVI